MSEQQRCSYEVWNYFGEICGEPAEENGLCAYHQGIECVVCGKPAERDCKKSVDGLTCGAPLCDECKCNRHWRNAE